MDDEGYLPRASLPPAANPPDGPAGKLKEYTAQCAVLIGALRFTGHCLSALPDFIRREIFFMRCNEPDMSERVFQGASPVTIKLILNRLDNLGAGIDGLGEQLVHIIHI